jgi:hypothetical protein
MTSRNEDSLLDEEAAALILLEICSRHSLSPRSESGPLNA